MKDFTEKTKHNLSLQEIKPKGIKWVIPAIFRALKDLRIFSGRCLWKWCSWGLARQRSTELLAVVALLVRVSVGGFNFQVKLSD